MSEAVMVVLSLLLVVCVVVNEVARRRERARMQRLVRSALESLDFAVAGRPRAERGGPVDWARHALQSALGLEPTLGPATDGAKGAQAVTR